MKIKKAKDGKKKIKVPSTDGMQVTFVPLRHIVDSDELNYRALDADHVEELRGSFKTNGMETPLFTWDGGDPDTKVQIGKDKEPVAARFLVAGQHRREALREFHQEDPTGFKAKFPNGIPCFVFTGPVEGMIALQVRENVARKNPEPSEILPQLLQLREAGMKGNAIAAAIGKTKGYVSGIFAIEDELGEEGTDAVKKKKLGVGDAIKTAAKAKKDKKAGKSVDKKAVVAAAVEKSAAKKKKDKPKTRFSAKTLHTSYVGLPNLKLGKKLEILEAALAHLADPDENKVPSELIPEEKAKPSADKGKKKKKKKKAKAADEDDED